MSGTPNRAAVIFTFPYFLTQPSIQNWAWEGAVSNSMCNNSYIKKKVLLKCQTNYSYPTAITSCSFSSLSVCPLREPGASRLLWVLNFWLCHVGEESCTKQYRTSFKPQAYVFPRQVCSWEEIINQNTFGVFEERFCFRVAYGGAKWRLLNLSNERPHLFLLKNARVFSP